MANKTISFPVKKKLGTVCERTRGKTLSELETTQFALERAVKRIDAIEKQADGLAKLDKEKEIRINNVVFKMKRLEQRVYEGDVE